MPTFRLGEMVRIKDGPFAAFTGRIEGINQARSLLKVKVNIYGRQSPMRIKFSGAEKLNLKEGSTGEEKR